MNNFDLSFTSSTTGLLFLSVVVFLVVLVISMRRFFSQRAQSDLTAKYKDKDWGSPLKARSKYPDVDIFEYSGALYKLGFAAALAITLFAFSWTTYEKDVFVPDNAMDFDMEIEIEPPRTAEAPPPPPPPPPPVIQEVPDEFLLEEDEPIFLDQDITEETVIDAPDEVEEAEEAAPPPPPPPPPPPEENVDEIFKVVEQRPRFPGCENMSGSHDEKETCAKDKLLQYIYKNLEYPNVARENGVEGTVVIQFVVGKTGSVEDVNIVRDIGAGCGEEAAKVVERMNSMPQKWTPGKQRGKAVKVLYTLPVKFQLLTS